MNVIMNVHSVVLHTSYSVSFYVYHVSIVYYSSDFKLYWLYLYIFVCFCTFGSFFVVIFLLLFYFAVAYSIQNVLLYLLLLKMYHAVHILVTTQ